MVENTRVLQLDPSATLSTLAGFVPPATGFTEATLPLPIASRRSTGSERQKYNHRKSTKRTAEKTRRARLPPRETIGSDSSSDGSEDDTDNKKHNKLPHKGAQRLLACPFWREDPVLNKSCLSIKMKRIRDVKQHLRRSHYPPDFYCPICFEEYSSRDEWEQHMVSRQCEPLTKRPQRRAGVVSKEAQDILVQRADRTKSDSEQWHAIWKVLFRKEALAQESAYLGSMVEETMKLVSDIWMGEAPEIMAQLLKSRPELAGMTREVQGLMLELFDEVKVRFEQKFGENRGEDSDSTLKQTRDSAPTTVPNLDLVRPLHNQHAQQLTLDGFIPNFGDDTIGWNLQTNVNSLAQMGSWCQENAGRQLPEMFMVEEPGAWQPSMVYQETTDG
ncbi:hypothetical protein OQA88_923 [Cercophora sp. LCS_1]